MEAAVPRGPCHSSLRWILAVGVGHGYACCTDRRVPALSAVRCLDGRAGARGLHARTLSVNYTWHPPYVLPYVSRMYYGDQKRETAQ